MSFERKVKNKKLMCDREMENEFNKKPIKTTLMRIWRYSTDNGKENFLLFEDSSRLKI